MFTSALVVSRDLLVKEAVCDSDNHHVYNYIGENKHMDTCPSGGFLVQGQCMRITRAGLSGEGVQEDRNKLVEM